MKMETILNMARQVESLDKDNKITIEKAKETKGFIIRINLYYKGKEFMCRTCYRETKKETYITLFECMQTHYAIERVCG